MLTGEGTGSENLKKGHLKAPGKASIKLVLDDPSRPEHLGVGNVGVSKRRIGSVACHDVTLESHIESGQLVSFILLVWKSTWHSSKLTKWISGRTWSVLKLLGAALSGEAIRRRMNPNMVKLVALSDTLLRLVAVSDALSTNMPLTKLPACEEACP